MSLANVVMNSVGTVAWTAVSRWHMTTGAFATETGGDFWSCLQ